MAFQLSPGVNVSEIDLTTVVPSVATSDGAIGGVFRWGPVGQRVLVDSENILVARFGKPTNFNAETFFTAANFLSYSNRLWVARAANTGGSVVDNVNFVITANSSVSNNILVGNTTGIEVGMYITQSSNATAIAPEDTTVSVASVNSTAVVLTKNLNVSATASTANSNLYFGRLGTSYSALAISNTTAKVSNLVNQIVKNENDYVAKDGNFDSNILYAAKYPGSIGNSLRISVCDSAVAYNSTAIVGNSTVNSTALFTIGSQTAYAKFEGSSNNGADRFFEQLAERDRILVGNTTIGQQYVTIDSITVSGDATTNVEFNAALDVSNTTGFISVDNNPFVDGDIVLYGVGLGTEITGIGDGNQYYVVGANSSGFKLSTEAFGDVIDLTSGDDETHTFTSNTNTVEITLVEPYRLRENFYATSVERYWEFFNVVETAPGQSDFVRLYGNTSANDELHAVVVDDDGLFTGTPGTILEVYKGLSRATDAKNNDGSANYYKDVINENSNYVWWANDRTSAESATAAAIVSSNNNSVYNANFKMGNDGYSESEASLSTIGEAYDLFISPEDIDISLVLQGKPIGGTTAVGGQTIINYQLANYIIDNICETRKDCVALISPDKSYTLNNTGNEASSLKNWRGAIRSTSYAVLDSGYKYQYDRYNDIYRWLPMNGDIGGLCARTDQSNDAWWSPAGFNRGQIKNIVKLAWNPRKSERDVLYANGVNPVVTFPGQGTVLYGDKTLQAKPSAFDRINVRRLFIVLEKAISAAAKYSLFEFNDAFTRAQFKNLVTPYLRNIQGRRGITDFLVVCDDTNNTAQVIDSNQFVGDIYIKPARSINFIQLNFVAVGTGVQFSEVVGKF